MLTEKIWHEANPSKAREKNIFDSHCHIDRILGKGVGKPGALTRMIATDPGNFGPKFEGCISVFCDPRKWAGVSI